jgi:tubulin polyglutamylase TTLL4
MTNSYERRQQPITPHKHSTVADALADLTVLSGEDGESLPESSDDDDDLRSITDDDEDSSATSAQIAAPIRASRAGRLLHVPYPKSIGLCRAADDTDLVAAGVLLRFKISGRVWQYNAVVNALRAAGLAPTPTTSLANLYWGRHLPGFAYATLIRPWQKLNHFPGTWCLGRKDRLAGVLARARARFGPGEFAFAPPTFVLPADRPGLERAAAAAPDAVWIQKPYSSSCGKGIRLVRRPGRIRRRARCVVSRYVRAPFLIDGFKFDLRLYALVTCMDPLRVYLNDDGLVRFATERFALSRGSLSHRRMHLTNYSVNKGARAFVRNADAAQAATGSKWSVKALSAWLADHGTDPGPVFDRIRDLVVKTMIVAEAQVQKRCARLRVGRTNCFELFGVDVLLDAQLRPWLLEVNILPSLSSSSPLDKLIKTRLMSDVFHVIGVPIVDGRGSPPPSLPDPDPKSHVNLLNLSPSDVAILTETELEYRRRGHLERIFPTPTTRSYAKFFDAPRYNNVLLERWLALPRRQALRLINMVEELSKP